MRVIRAKLKPKKERKEKEDRPPLWNRHTWLAKHPDDRPMDIENQKARQRGFDNDGFRALIAAVCLRACADYKKASVGKKVDGKHPDKVLRDCRRFFGEDMFQFFVNGMTVAEIERYIRATPEGSIHAIWCKNENAQRPFEDI